MESILLPALFVFAPQLVPLATGQWTCEPERWATPTTYEDGMFKGALVADCRITQAQGGGIPALDQHLLRRIGESRTIHSGPTAGSYDGLPSVVYDVTVDVQDAEHSFVIRQNSHIATDQQKRLVFFTDSKKVEGKDDESKHVRKLDAYLEVTKDKEPGAYRLRLGSTVHIKKPWYAPEGTFKSRSEKGAIEGFRAGRDQTLPELSSTL